MHFLVQVLCSFCIIFAVMFVMSLVKPLPEPRKLPAREEIALKTEPIVWIAAAVVVTAVAAMFVIFR